MLIVSLKLVFDGSANLINLKFFFFNSSNLFSGFRALTAFVYQKSNPNKPSDFNDIVHF